MDINDVILDNTEYTYAMLVNTMLNFLPTRYQYDKDHAHMVVGSAYTAMVQSMQTSVRINTLVKGSIPSNDLILRLLQFIYAKRYTEGWSDALITLGVQELGMKALDEII